MKKNILLGIALSVISSLFADGTKIGNLYYNLYPSNRTAEVTYRDHYHYKNIYIGVNRDEYNKGWIINTAIIPETVEHKGILYTVTSIGENAFKDCKLLEKVVIPNTVTAIHTDAFSGCRNLPIIDNIRYADSYLIEVVDKTLSKYTINNSTKWIGEFAFQNCRHLLDITIPESVVYIGEMAFDGCSELNTIVIPNSVKNIESQAFSNCPKLIIYTCTKKIIDFPSNRQKWISPEYISYYYPFFYIC